MYLEVVSDLDEALDGTEEEVGVNVALVNLVQNLRKEANHGSDQRNVKNLIAAKNIMLNLMLRG